MHKSWVKAIGVMLTLSALPTYAQDADTVADVRCLVVGLKMMQLSDASMQKAGYISFMYYVGRLDGRTPSLDIEQSIIKELDHMTAPEFSAEAVRCGGGLTKKGEQLQRIGKDLADHGR